MKRIVTCVIAACGGTPAHPTVAKTATDSIAAKPMAGPYKSVADFCAAAMSAYPKDRDDGANLTCDTGSRAPLAFAVGDLADKPTPLSPPFTSADIVVIGRGEASCTLGLEVAGQLYTIALAERCGEATSRTRTGMTVLELASRSGIVIGRFETNERQSNMDNLGWQSETTTELEVVCGIGGSGKPSCAGPIEVSKRWHSGPLDYEAADSSRKPEQGEEHHPFDPASVTFP
jgi:hypothetical protein